MIEDRNRYDLLFGYDRRGRYPQEAWMRAPGERSPASAPAVVDPAPGSRQAGDLHPRPHHRTAPVTSKHR